ncbi:UNVERIFIED_CONTAM: hypothetical protein HDU68_008463, partial [Siphonaria sp. JEL0065]
MFLQAVFAALTATLASAQACTAGAWGCNNNNLSVCQDGVWATVTACTATQGCRAAPYYDCAGPATGGSTKTTTTTTTSKVVSSSKPPTSTTTTTTKTKTTAAATSKTTTTTTTVVPTTSTTTTTAKPTTMTTTTTTTLTATSTGIVYGTPCPVLPDNSLRLPFPVGQT